MEYVLELSHKYGVIWGGRDGTIVKDIWGPIWARPIAKEIFGGAKYSAAEWDTKSERIVLARTGTQTKFGHVIGFIAGHEREHNTQKTWHIWMTGVLPEARRKGVFSAMVDKFIASKPPHINCLSVCTYPDKFPEMYEWIKNFGFTEVPVDGFPPEKKYFEMPIPTPPITTYYRLFYNHVVIK